MSKRTIHQVNTSNSGSDGEPRQKRTRNNPAVLSNLDNPEVPSNVDNPVLSCIPLLALHHLKNGRISTHERFFGAFLCVDIEGFTNLAATDVNFKSTVESIFRRLINIITDYCGDIVKFTGDGFQIVWRCAKPIFNTTTVCNPAVYQAIMCSLKCAVELAGFDKTNNVVVRVGFGFGEMLGIITNYQYGLGTIQRPGPKQRKEYFILGKAVEDGIACEKASKNFRKKLVNRNIHGVFVTSEFYNNFRDLFDISLPDQNRFDDEDQKQNFYYFTANTIPVAPTSLSLRSRSGHIECEKNRLYNMIKEKAQSRLIPFEHELSRNGGVIPASTTQEPVICMFIKFTMEGIHTLTKHHVMSPSSFDKKPFERKYDEEGFRRTRTAKERKDDKDLHLVFHICFGILGKALRENDGFLRQFIQDDKGVVGICTFSGQKLSILRKNAFKAAMHIQEKVISASRDHEVKAFKVQASIGLSSDTKGAMFFENMGPENRREFMVLGLPVIIAARLAFKRNKNEISCHELSVPKRLYSGYKLTTSRFAVIKRKLVVTRQKYRKIA